MKKTLYLSIILVAGLLSSCKKDKKITPAKTNTGTDTTKTTTSAIDLVRDSIFLYSKEDYFWNTQLPSYSSFNPRSYTSGAEFASLQNEMDALSQYAINPATNKPYEYSMYSPGSAKYSFIDDGTETGALNGNKSDYGFDYGYEQVDENTVKIFILYVYPGSAAAAKGLTRGCEITAINGNTSISYDGSGYGSGSGAHNNLVYDAIFNSTTLSMTVTKLNGTSATVSMSNVAYTVNPVLKDTVLDLGGGHKLGYMAFNTFTSPSNAQPKLDAAFKTFSSGAITDLVVDLRYNGGGDISTAEYLDNLIVPLGVTSTMYTTVYNANLTTGKDPLLKNQVYNDGQGQFTLADVIASDIANNTKKFAKAGSLNVPRVFFMVGPNTASASELTINNLRALSQIDVQLVGDTTYGKPVGFYGLYIGNYIMYNPQFATVNSAGQGGYYAGMTPGTGGYKGYEIFDDYRFDFGDRNDPMLKHIINYITLSTYSMPTKVTQSLAASANQGYGLRHAATLNKKRVRRTFNGMIFNRKTTLRNVKHK
jgi:carboxyl-terminal processing protease